jgi:hypothetical protein
MVCKMKPRKINAFSITVVLFSLICFFYINIFLTKISIINKQSPTTATITDDWITKMDEKYRKTKERIRKICKEYRATIPSKFTNNDKGIKRNVVESLMVDVKHRLAYCPVEKVK